MDLTVDLRPWVRRMPGWLKPSRRTDRDGETRTAPGRGQVATHALFGIFVVVLAVVMLVVGVHNLHQCPAEPMVPGYLIGETDETSDLRYYIWIIQRYARSWKWLY